MAFTLQDAAAVWNKLYQSSDSASPSVAVGNIALDLGDYQSNEELEKRLKDLFHQVNVAYPEKSHVLHLKTTLLAALSHMDDK
jgi:hypothetical protein